MIWPVAILVILVVFGSVYWLKPSPRDKRLAELRLDAIKRKLQIRQFTYQPDAKKTGIRDSLTGTSYTLVNAERRNDGALVARVVGQPGWDQDGLPEGMAWHDQGDAALAAKITAALAALSDDILLLEIYNNRVTMIPAERKTASAENYQRFLQALLPS